MSLASGVRAAGMVAMVPLISTRPSRRGWRVLMILQAQPGGLEVPGYGQGAEHDGQVCLDRTPGVVEDRSGTQVGFCHPERGLDLEQRMIGGHDLCPGEHCHAGVSHVPLEPEEPLGDLCCFVGDC